MRKAKGNGYEASGTRKSRTLAASRGAGTSALKNPGKASLCLDGRNASCSPDLVSLERTRGRDGDAAQGAQAEGAKEKPKSVTHDR